MLKRCWIVGNRRCDATMTPELIPGVGAQGGSAADVIRAGADYVIVGRAIYQADDPKGAAREIAQEIKGAL